MKKQQKKDLMVLGGIVAGVVILALGAFALNPQGGVYKGLITTTDIKLLTEDRTTTDLTEKESEEEIKSITESIGVLPTATINVPTPLPPQKWPSAVPIITGDNPYYNPNFPDPVYTIPGTYGTEAEVLFFNVDAHGSQYKQTGEIYLHDFYVEYDGCLGDSDLDPVTVPYLTTKDGYILMADYNMDGVFNLQTEFVDKAFQPANGIPVSIADGKEYGIRMEVTQGMCAGSNGKVVVNDILWANGAGDYYLYDPDIENELISIKNTTNPYKYTVTY